MSRCLNQVLCLDLLGMRDPTSNSSSLGFSHNSRENTNSFRLESYLDGSLLALMTNLQHINWKYYGHAKADNSSLHETFISTAIYFTLNHYECNYLIFFK